MCYVYILYTRVVGSDIKHFWDHLKIKLQLCQMQQSVFNMQDKYKGFKL